jgi:type I restriction enzyme S subunit
LAEVCEIVSGATPSTGEKSFWNGGIFWTTPKDLGDLETPYLEQTSRTITEEGLKSCAASILPPNSVLLSSRAPIGLVAINAVPMATNQGFKSLVPDARKVDSKFLFHWLRSKTAYLQSLGNGATFKEISKAVVERIEIPVPPLNEQKRIAAILDKADSLRRKRRRALELLDGLVQSIFLEMFGDPIENTKRLPIVNLENVVSPSRKITYGILKPGPDYAGGIPYVRVIDIQNSLIDFAGLKRTTPAIASEYKRSTILAGDLLISIRGHVGRMAIVPPECNGANITQDTARLAITAANTEFVKAQLETDPAKHWMARRTKGAAVKGINLGDLRQFPLIAPPSQLQDEFAEKVRTVRSVLEKGSRQNDSLDAFFSSLQHRAFSGQL